MITATLLKRFIQNDGTVKLIISYTDGTNTATKEYTFSGTFDLNSFVNSEISNLQNLWGTVTSFTEGPLTIIPPTIPSVAANVTQFLTDLHTLRQMRAAIAVGIKSASDPDVIAQVASVKAELTSDLLNYL